MKGHLCYYEKMTRLNHLGNSSQCLLKRERQTEGFLQRWIASSWSDRLGQKKKSKSKLNCADCETVWTSEWAAQLSEAQRGNPGLFIGIHQRASRRATTSFSSPLKQTLSPSCPPSAAPPFTAHQQAINPGRLPPMCLWSSGMSAWDLRPLWVTGTPGRGRGRGAKKENEDEAPLYLWRGTWWQPTRLMN